MLQHTRATWAHTCIAPEDTLQMCRDPLNPRRFVRRSAVKQMTRSLPLDCTSCHSNIRIVTQAQHLVGSRKEHWYYWTFGGFFFVEKVEVVLGIHFWTCKHTKLEVDAKVVAVPDLRMCRILEPCKLQQLLLLCLRKPSPWIAAVERLP